MNITYLYRTLRTIIYPFVLKILATFFLFKKKRKHALSFSAKRQITNNDVYG